MFVKIYVIAFLLEGSCPNRRNLLNLLIQFSFGHLLVLPFFVSQSLIDNPS
jgi:hypothetical protein